MLHHATQLGRQATDQVSVNVSVEQFALHLRNLIAFFWAKRVHDTDVLAADFCSPAGAWAMVQAAHPLKGTVLEGAKERADREIAHLTTPPRPDLVDEGLRQRQAGPGVHGLPEVGGRQAGP